MRTEEEFQRLAAERDEWKRRAEESDALNEGLNLALRLAQDDRDRHEAQARTESTRARKAEALAAKKLVDYADLDIRHDALLARAAKAEAERDEWKRRAEAAQSEAVRVVQVHQHEWLMRASARETFENYVMRVMAASGADANFDDCFRNIIADYDRVLARADKAEAERDEWKRRADSFSESYDNIDHRCNVETERADKAEAEQNAAMALVRDLRDPSPCDHFDHHGHCQTHGWMETDPPCPHGRATKLLEALGEK